MTNGWEQLPILMDIKTVREVLGISQSLVYQIVHSQNFPLVKISKRKYLVPRDALRQWLESRENAV